MSNIGLAPVLSQEVRKLIIKWNLEKLLTFLNIMKVSFSRLFNVYVVRYAQFLKIKNLLPYEMGTYQRKYLWLMIVKIDQFLPGRSLILLMKNESLEILVKVRS